MWRSSLSIVLLLASNASLANCEALRETLISSSVPDSQALHRLGELAQSDDLCAQNLLGRLFFEGRNLPKDIDRAHAIFYSLAMRGFPPGQFNLAYVLTKEKPPKVLEIVSLLQGIFAAHVGSDEYGRIASNSRELARNFLDEQIELTRRCSDSVTCEPQPFSLIELLRLRDAFEAYIARANHDAATEVIRNSRQLRETSNAIVGLLSLGVAANAAAANRMASSLAPRAAVPCAVGCSPPSIIDLKMWGVLK